MEVYTFDDGSQIARDGETVLSREIGAVTWQDDPLPAPAGWSVFSSDQIEQAKMGGAYPANGLSWDENAAAMGISRVIDTAARAWAQVKGTQPATYAGQNGQTYVNGRATAAGGGFVLSPLLLLLGLGAAALLLKKG